MYCYACFGNCTWFFDVICSPGLHGWWRLTQKSLDWEFMYDVCVHGREGKLSHGNRTSQIARFSLIFLREHTYICEQITPVV